jgi:hypothetical protein
MTHAILWMLAGCGDKEPTSTAAVAEAKTQAASVVPADETSRLFALKLAALDIQDFHPASGGGGKIVYTHLKFRDEGVWAATGYVEAQDERIDCSETGSWKMEPATSATTATMTWKTDTTDCAGRDAGAEQRVLVTIKDDGKIETDFR